MLCILYGLFELEYTGRTQMNVFDITVCNYMTGYISIETYM
jgi:hypothetical protein